jgi:hypothetical protein
MNPNAFGYLANDRNQRLTHRVVRGNSRRSALVRVHAWSIEGSERVSALRSNSDLFLVSAFLRL